MSNESINERLFAFVRPSKTTLAKQYIQKHGLEKITDLPAHQITALKRALASNLSNKEGFLRATSGLGIDKQRLDLIFDNETHQANEQAGLKYAASEGANTKTWSCDGPNPCDECASMDGEETNISEAFSNGEMVAHLHPNCNCHTTYQKS